MLLFCSQRVWPCRWAWCSFSMVVVYVDRRRLNWDWFRLLLLLLFHLAPPSKELASQLQELLLGIATICSPSTLKAWCRHLNWLSFLLQIFVVLLIIGVFGEYSVAQLELNTDSSLLSASILPTLMRKLTGTRDRATAKDAPDHI